MPASITLTVAHLPTSTSFFLSVLQPINYVFRGRVNDTIGFGHPDAAPDFWITQSIPGVPPGPAHVAFPALSRAKVHEFFHAALKAGGKVHGEPALRDECGYYSAAVIDFDGNSIEAVYRPDLLEASKDSTADAASTVSKTKSTTSKASSHASAVSKAKSSASSKVSGSVAASRAPTAVQQDQRSTVSRTQTTTGTPSEAPARTTITRSATAPVVPSQQPTTTGNNLIDVINEARNTVVFARDLVNQARPLMNTVAASPAASTVNKSESTLSTSPISHGPSDAIVGTLLGVAAGAALHYAFANRNKPTEVASAPVTPPTYEREMAPSESAPSYTQERYQYYYQQPQFRALPPASSEAAHRPYAIEAPISEFSRVSITRTGQNGQKLIEMYDNDPTLSQFTSSSSRRRGSTVTAASTIKPRRRSSFSGAPSSASAAGPPPTSYRPPTVITMQSDGTKVRRSRTGSLSRSSSTTSKTSKSRRSAAAAGSSAVSGAGAPAAAADEGYASASEDRRSRTSRHSHHSRHSRHHSTSPPTTSTPTTPTPGSTVSYRKSSHDKPPSALSVASSPSTVITAIKTAILTPSETPLPASRAASHIDTSTRKSDDDKTSSYHSTHSKTHKTVIGRLTERQLAKLEQGGRLERGAEDGVTKSVIGKVKDVDRLDVSDREVGPEDSVSQVSSSRGSRRSGAGGSRRSTRT